MSREGPGGASSEGRGSERERRGEEEAWGMIIDQSTVRPNTITTAVQSIFHFLELSTCHYLGVCGTKISLAGPGDLHHTSDSPPGGKNSRYALTLTITPRLLNPQKEITTFSPPRPALHQPVRPAGLRSPPTLRKFSAETLIRGQGSLTRGHG